MTNNADISVLGAGVFGLVASIMIKKKGFSVTVVDRNFGMNSTMTSGYARF